jgi:hydroxymethylglutaryl-CoA lyase
MSERVEIVEVAPRDGLQSDPAMPSTGVKVELIERLVAAGVSRFEATSFVNPTRVPQMADADAVMAAVPPAEGISRIGLVLNRRGFDRALEAGVDEVNAVVVASETFCQRNQGMSTAESVEVFAGIAGVAKEAGIGTSVTIAASFGCPFEGEMPVSRLDEVVDMVLEHAPDEIALADTIGVAVPSDVEERLGRLVDRDDVRVRCHFHNTRNTGIANVAAAAAAGVRVFDSSVGGIGGCPFAPAATGNIATEDVVYMLHRMGYDTGLDLDALIATAHWLETALDHSVPSMLSKAGPFPS